MSPKSFESRVQPWAVVRENKEYSTPIFNLLKRRLRLQAPGDHAEGDFYILQAPAWVNVIPMTAAGEVILVEQYRYGTREATLEIPGGMVDGGEEPVAAAKRELLEETGYRSGQWKALGRVSANPAILSNYAHIYLAEECTYQGAENPDEHERIIVHTVPLEECLQMVAEGTIHHAIVVAAFARLMLQRRGSGM